MKIFSRLQRSFAFITLVFACFSSTEAQEKSELRLPAIISDNMVLQSGVNPTIWGWAAAGETITVNIAEQSKSTVASSEGKWMLKLDPISARGPFEMTVKNGSASLTVHNILIGEVWLCSGQSNMELKIHDLYPETIENESKTADYPEIRYFGVVESALKEPALDCRGAWVICKPDTFRDFSAVAYFFGRKLFQDLKVPIGLIGSFRGATYIEQWMSQDILESKPDFKPIVDRLLAGESAGAFVGNSHPGEQAACFFNGMIAPLIPYSIRGVTWYQGEGNVPRGYQYRDLMPALIGDWRGKWKEGDFPFLFVQLPNIAETDQPSLWQELREAQLKTLSVPGSGMAVTIDIGEAGNIHPHNKQDVGLRLGLIALAQVYGQKDLVFQGPMYKSTTVSGRNIKIKFQAMKGLLVSKDGGPLKYFTIAGQDQKFVPATATIIGDRVEVSSPEVKDPVAVRYAWRDNPENPNLVNKEGLPASPFRSDDWPGLTVEKK